MATYCKLLFVFVFHFSPLFAFCNGNQRFALRRHWQLSANSWKSEISKDLYRAAVMSPKLEMSAVVQCLFSVSFLFRSLCQGTLLNHPSTQQTCHCRCTPLQAASSWPPPRLYSLFDVFSRNQHTLRAGEQHQRAFHSLFTVSSVINSQVQNSNFL